MPCHVSFRSTSTPLHSVRFHRIPFIHSSTRALVDLFTPSLLRVFALFACLLARSFVQYCRQSPHQGHQICSLELWSKINSQPGVKPKANQQPLTSHQTQSRVSNSIRPTQGTFTPTPQSRAVHKHNKKNIKVFICSAAEPAHPTSKYSEYLFAGRSHEMAMTRCGVLWTVQVTVLSQRNQQTIPATGLNLIIFVLASCAKTAVEA